MLNLRRNRKRQAACLHFNRCILSSDRSAACGSAPVVLQRGLFAADIRGHGSVSRAPRVPGFARLAPERQLDTTSCADSNRKYSRMWLLASKLVAWLTTPSPVKF